MKKSAITLFMLSGFIAGYLGFLIGQDFPFQKKNQKSIQFSQSQKDYINLVNENLQLKESDSIQKKEITQIKKELANIRNQMNSWIEFKKEVDSFKREYEGNDPL